MTSCGRPPRGPQPRPERRRQRPASSAQRCFERGLTDGCARGEARATERSELERATAWLCCARSIRWSRAARSSAIRFALPITGGSADMIAQGARDSRNSPGFASSSRRAAALPKTVSPMRSCAACARWSCSAPVSTPSRLRNPYAGKGLRVFEVDRPETQRFKQVCLKKANLPVPAALTFVAVDFERQSFRRPSCCSRASARRSPSSSSGSASSSICPATPSPPRLAAVAKLPDAEIVFDYGEPPASIAAAPSPPLPGHDRAGAKARASPGVASSRPRKYPQACTKIGFSDWTISARLPSRPATSRRNFRRGPAAILFAPAKPFLNAAPKRGLGFRFRFSRPPFIA